MLSKLALLVLVARYAATRSRAPPASQRSDEFRRPIWIGYRSRQARLGGTVESHTRGALVIERDEMGSAITAPHRGYHPVAPTVALAFNVVAGALDRSHQLTDFRYCERLGQDVLVRATANDIARSVRGYDLESSTPAGAEVIAHFDLPTGGQSMRRRVRGRHLGAAAEADRPAGFIGRRRLMPECRTPGRDAPM